MQIIVLIGSALSGKTLFIEGACLFTLENLEKESLKNLDFLNLKASMELIRYVRLVSSVLYR